MKLQQQRSERLRRHENNLLQVKYGITAWFYDILDCPWERRYRKWRPELLKDIHGEVLEPGVGTGRNLKCYHNDVRLTGIDLSPAMLKRAQTRERDAQCRVTLKQEDTTLPASIPSNHFYCFLASHKLPSDISIRDLPVPTE